jgi:hypothetical protein
MCKRISSTRLTDHSQIEYWIREHLESGPRHYGGAVLGCV